MDEHNDQVLLQEEPGARDVLEYRQPGACRRSSFNGYDVLTLASVAMLFLAIYVKSVAASKLSIGEQLVKSNWLAIYPIRVMLALLATGAVTATVAAVLGRGLRMWAVSAAALHLTWLGLLVIWWRAG